ncbi:hypothetical protein H2248_007495 [Termitomyces sp. 'cryptogamus']|nr:hypothetical protein H2248_007495 [Termitomyces sp. 'cryptogamus']
MVTLLWVCDGAFKLRQVRLELLSKRLADHDTYHPHPHPQYNFTDIPISERDCPNRGLRLRTVMVSNVPVALRNEKDLKEYFEFYMSRKLVKPSIRIGSTLQPGFFNRSFAFLFNRAKRLPTYMPAIPLLSRGNQGDSTENQYSDTSASRSAEDVPDIERVVITRKMTSIASLLERREAILYLLETAHIKLAKKTLLSVKEAMDRRHANLPAASGRNRAAEIARKQRAAADSDPEGGTEVAEVDEEARMDQLIEVLGPFVEEFGLQESFSLRSKRLLNASSRYAFRKLWSHPSSDDSPQVHSSSDTPCLARPHSHKTVWEALHSLPRSSLDAYQPLINLNYIFVGKIVPAIDYYTTKLNMLTSLVTDSRSKAPSDYDPLSTAFVTFSDPADARRACKYLAVHPNNPLVCMVTMAPMYQDLDWIRVMKSPFDVEFVKDWVVNLGVWGFTLFWLFPVSLLVGLVSIQNISLFWPSLKKYLDRHAWEEELIQSFLPTLLVALLALLIPLILLLIAKKAHTFTTLSAMHDIILTRYYKFLIVNVLVFFCVGTAALQSILQSFNPSAPPPDIIQVVADSFPTAGPFYVGWLIFTTATHGGFELALFGVRFYQYLSTMKFMRRVATAYLVFHYVKANDTVSFHIFHSQLITALTRIPDADVLLAYDLGHSIFILIHVYAKNYENNGKVILIRIVRYSLDGLLLAQANTNLHDSSCICLTLIHQAIFLTYMVVLKKSANVGLAAFLILFTAVVKLVMTRMCRAQFEKDDINEANLVCNVEGDKTRDTQDHSQEDQHDLDGSTSMTPTSQPQRLSILTWRLPRWINLSYATVRSHRPQYRHLNPFRPQNAEFSLKSTPQDKRVTPRASQTSMRPSISKSLREQDTYQSFTDVSELAVKHAPPISWDDETTEDLPYDNPFYTRTFDNVLWLPRDPFGTLDLDDTVDLRVSLCVDVIVGQLGSWLGLRETASPVPTYEEPSTGLNKSSIGSLQPIDGTENIELPPTIAQRVGSKDGDLERTLRQKASTHRRKSSGATLASIEAGTVRRPPVNRGDSLQGDIGDSGRGRSLSILAHFPSYLQSQSHITAQRSLPQISGEALSARTNESTSHLSNVSHGPPNSITARQAIFSEVLAEERAALVNQIEDEEEQTQRATSGKSWLTAWMFSRRE